MKSTIISMFIILIVMIVVPMILLNDDDFTGKFDFGGGSDLRAKTPKNVKPAATDKKIEIYKWADEHGVMQFSNAPPAEGGESEMMVLLPDTNVMDAIEIPEVEPEVIGKPQVYSLGSPYSPGGVKDLVDESKDMQEMLEQRQADQDKMIKDMFK